jgi:ATP-dependent DNA helicase RecG
LTKLTDIKALSKPVLTGLSRLGIVDTQGLLLHMPLRYIDETRIIPIVRLNQGMQAQVEGEIIHQEIVYKPRKTLMIKLRDASGELSIRFIHFYPSQIKSFQVGVKIRALGEVRYGFFGYEMIHPQIRVVTEQTTLSQSLTPIYPTTAGLSQAKLRFWINWALKNSDVDEIFSSHVYPGHFPTFKEALYQLHFPDPAVSLETLENRSSPAWQRLAFDELLAHQLSMRQYHAKRRQHEAPPLKALGQRVQQLVNSLPFGLTQAQQKVFAEISQDLTQPYPMQRLLQGDVGSGKTIVATLAALQAIENNYQVAMMAPTEILAEQHYQKLVQWLSPLGINIAWLTGSQSKKEREQQQASVASGEAQLVIGTHALFQHQVEFNKLGFIIIDEQHRFGVEQRLTLRQKGKHISPHQLMMSATPIPRTLSMSYFADLDVSVIDELPPGRTPVTTRLVSNNRRSEIMERVRQACSQGFQVYWVCPLIEESETLQLETAMDTFALLRDSFPELTVGLIHGRLKPAEKQDVMDRFLAGDIDLLVATTVIEVGVDVPNAALMVIEHAERMGLSQLHQLRGRVGRGEAKSTCILMYQSPLSEMARARLKIIYESTNGFEIAEADLNLRGPGEFLGVRQSGLPMLKIADIHENEGLLIHAQKMADNLLKAHPNESKKHLNRWLSRGEELIKS